MKSVFIMIALLGLLTACSGATPTLAPLPTIASIDAGSIGLTGNTDLARTDSQGSVEFVVTPLNLDSPGDTFNFDVSMNTHSVDLSWDLAALSVLNTNTGLEVKGLKWPVGSGHHYAGTFTFPAATVDGQPLLTGAKKLTLTIKDAGVPERIFEWEISQ
jgi:hypothetical protein